MEMLQTRVFGEIGIVEEKVITFPNGIVGFPMLKRFTLLFDAEKGSNVGIKWLQSIDEPNFAIPVMDPLAVKNDYNPAVEGELRNPLDGLTEENLLVLVSVNVPSDLTKMTVNLQAPFIINADSRKGCQVIVEGDDNPIKFEIYDILQKNRK